MHEKNQAPCLCITLSASLLLCAVLAFTLVQGSRPGIPFGRFQFATFRLTAIGLIGRNDNGGPPQTIPIDKSYLKKVDKNVPGNSASTSSGSMQTLTHSCRGGRRNYSVEETAKAAQGARGAMEAGAGRTEEGCPPRIPASGLQRELRARLTPAVLHTYAVVAFHLACCVGNCGESLQVRNTFWH